MGLGEARAQRADKQQAESFRGAVIIGRAVARRVACEPHRMTFQRGHDVAELRRADPFPRQAGNDQQADGAQRQFNARRPVDTDMRRILLYPAFDFGGAEPAGFRVLLQAGQSGDGLKILQPVQFPHIFHITFTVGVSVIDVETIGRVGPECATHRVQMPAPVSLAGWPCLAEQNEFPARRLPPNLPPIIEQGVGHAPGQQAVAQAWNGWRTHRVDAGGGHPDVSCGDFVQSPAHSFCYPEQDFRHRHGRQAVAVPDSLFGNGHYVLNASS